MGCSAYCATPTAGLCCHRYVTRGAGCSSFPRPASSEKGRGMTRRRMIHLPVLLGTLAAAVLIACTAALLMVSEKAEATFPGKNGRIAYSATDGNDLEIYTIKVGGGGKTKVTNNDTFDFHPAYSPDGKRIAYSGEGETGFDDEIYTVKVGGGGKTKVTNNDRNDFDPAYSPNGKRIAYTNYDGHDTEICTIKVGGGGKSRVTNDIKDEEEPSYSPNGKKIAYTGFKGLGTDEDEDFDHEIYTIKVGGGGKSHVTDTTYYASYPSWGSRP